MPLNEVCEALMKKAFLRTINLDRLKENLELLLGKRIAFCDNILITFLRLDNEIPIKDVHRDLWVLYYSNETIRYRLDLAKSLKVDKIKTWMIRCTPEVLDR